MRWLCLAQSRYFLFIFLPQNIYRNLSMQDHQKCLGQQARPKIPMRKVLTQITKSDTAPHCLSSKSPWMILANSSPIESMCSRETSLHEVWVVKANLYSEPPPMAALGCPYCLMFQKQIWRKNPVLVYLVSSKSQAKERMWTIPWEIPRTLEALYQEPRTKTRQTIVQQAQWPKTKHCQIKQFYT